MMIPRTQLAHLLSYALLPPLPQELKAQFASFKLSREVVPVRIHDKANTAYITFETGEARMPLFFIVLSQISRPRRFIAAAGRCAESSLACFQALRTEPVSVLFCVAQGAKQAHDFIFPRQQKLLHCSDLRISLTYPIERNKADRDRDRGQQGPPGGGYGRPYGQYGGGGGSAGYGGGGGYGPRGGSGPGGGGYGGGAQYGQWGSGGGGGGGGGYGGGGGADAGDRWSRPPGPPGPPPAQSRAPPPPIQQQPPQQQPMAQRPLGGGYGAVPAGGGYGGMGGGAGYGAMQQQPYQQAAPVASRAPLGVAPIDPRKARRSPGRRRTACESIALAAEHFEPCAIRIF